jgi:hypothetical protein
MTKWYTVYFDLPIEKIRTIFDLMEGECENFRFKPRTDPHPPPVIEVTPTEPPNRPRVTHRVNMSPEGPFRPRRLTRDWSKKFEPRLKEMVLARPNQEIRYDDPELSKLLSEFGYRPQSVSPLLSELGFRGVMKKGTGKGWWKWVGLGD